jgi:hypothetical protein
MGSTNEGEDDGAALLVVPSIPSHPPRIPHAESRFLPAGVESGAGVVSGGSRPAPGGLN